MDAESISVSKFYGSVSARKKPRSRQVNTLKLPLPFPSRILGPTICWQVFFRQNDAFNFAHRIAEDVMVFAFESCDNDYGSATGKRRFLVTSLDVFWHYYNQLDPLKRHHYEIIPEGCPCRLYFDLEFLKELNPSSQGDRMVDLLIQYVCAWLQEIFGITCQRCQILDLDASTETKFSRHLIFHLHNTVFQDCLTAGRFVHHIFNHLVNYVNLKSDGQFDQTNTEDNDILDDDWAFKEDREMGEICGQEDLLPRANCPVVSHKVGDGQDQAEDPGMRVCQLFSRRELRTLVVIGKDGKEGLFCDLGVYTRNRNFRLYLSSKLHKNNPLLLSAHNQFQRTSSDSLVSPQQAVFAASLVSCRCISSDMRILKFDCETTRPKNVTTSESTHKGEFLRGQNRSPYPEIDHFIEKTVSSHGCKGRIRRWTFFGISDSLIYDIAGYRWCGRIEREHTSNNIMYVVDLRRGLFYQKCYDPECQAAGYRSEAMAIPFQLLPSTFFDTELSQEESDNEDDILVAATMAFEAMEQKSLTHQSSVALGLDSCVGDDSSDDSQIIAAAEVAEKNWMKFVTRQQDRSVLPT